jgi:hypothetical protein
MAQQVFDQVPFTPHTANGVSTVFAYGFQVLSAADMVVYADGVAVPESEYVLAGLGVSSGGSVTFMVAPANGVKVLLNREIALERLTEYQTLGDFKAVVVNPDFNRLWMAMQGFGARIGGSIRAPYPQQLNPLPDPADFDGYYVGFSGGQPAFLLPPSGTAGALAADLASSAAGKGDALIGVKRTATGAAPTTAHARLEHMPLDLAADLGIPADGTDQTAAIVSALASLGVAYQGVLSCPMAMRFDAQLVTDALPDKCIFQFYVVKQTGSGYRQQFAGFMSNPPDANTDTAFMVADPHYPDVMLNNQRSAGTTSSSRGLSGVSWARGWFRNGSKGPRVQWQHNFAKSVERAAEYGGAGVACFVSKTRAPERAGNHEQWFNGIAVGIGDYIEATNGAFYRAESAGVSTVSPSHASGSATVGGVTWAFESSWIPFRTNFYYDELGRVGTNDCPPGYTHRWEQNPEDVEDFNVWYTAKGASKRIRMRFEPTNAGGANLGAPMLDISETGGFRMLDSTLARVYFRARNAAGFELANYGLVTNTVADGDTTPTAVNGGRLVLANTSATSVTTLDDATENQVVMLYATNGNTTLVHSANLVLKGAVNAALAANQCVTVMRNPANTAWVEIGRNF